MSNDLAFWKERLESENQRLKELYVFSHGVEHSATMDCKGEIKRFESKVKIAEEGEKEDKKETAPEGSVQEQSLETNTINQLRIKNGLKAIPNGDVHLITIK